MSEKDLRDWDVYNNVIEKYPNSIVIVSDEPIQVVISNCKGGRVVIEKGDTHIEFDEEIDPEEMEAIKDYNRRELEFMQNLNCFVSKANTKFKEFQDKEAPNNE